MKLQKFECEFENLLLFKLTTSNFPLSYTRLTEIFTSAMTSQLQNFNYNFYRTLVQKCEARSSWLQCYILEIQICQLTKKMVQIFRVLEKNHLQAIHSNSDEPHFCLHPSPVSISKLFVKDGLVNLLPGDNKL